MNYYDNVKDTVKDKGSAGSGSFDSLKEAAEESSGDEKEGDDTPIEVLEEDGLKKQPQQKKKSNTDTTSKDTVETGSDVERTGSGSVDVSGLEDKLDKIIEQNERMIEVLESFRG